MFNGLYVGQERQFYTIVTPQGITIAQIFLGQDGQYMRDVEVINKITKILAARWNVK